MNLESVLDSIISVLNEEFTSALFIRNYNIHTRPPYPFGTVSIVSGYIPENNSNKPNETRIYNADTDKIEVKLGELPQMTLSFNIISDDEAICNQLCVDVINGLKYIFTEKLRNNAIIVLEITNVQNRTALFEIDFEYKYGFDLRIRVENIVEFEVDTVLQIELNEHIIK